jgi:hypothetical protein
MKKGVKKGFVLFLGLFIFLIIGVGIVSAVNEDITYTSTISIKWDGGKYLSVHDANDNKYVRASQSQVDDSKERFLLSGSSTGQVKSGDKVSISSVFNGNVLEAKINWFDGNDWIKATDASYTSMVFIKKEGASDGEVITCGDLVYFVAYDNKKYFWEVKPDGATNRIAADGSKNLFYIYNADGACVIISPTTPITPDTPVIPTPDTPVIPDTFTIPPGDGIIFSCLDLGEEDCTNYSKWNYDVLDSIEYSYHDTSVPLGFCTDEPYSEILSDFPNCRQTLKCGCVWDDEAMLGQGACVGSVWPVYTNSTADGCGDLTLQGSCSEVGSSCEEDINCCSGSACKETPYGEECTKCLLYSDTMTEDGDSDTYSDFGNVAVIGTYSGCSDVNPCCPGFSCSVSGQDTSIQSSVSGRIYYKEGMCFPDSPLECFEDSQSCGRNEDCCSNKCEVTAETDSSTSRVCIPEIQICMKKLVGESCDDSNECCSNICGYSPPYRDNVCLNDIPGDTCKGIGRECENGFECCSDRCVLSQSTGKSTCAAADIIVTPVCKSLGRGCNMGSECCSDVCIDNVQKSAPPIKEALPILGGSCAMEDQLCGRSIGISCCEENDGLKLSCALTGLGDVGYCKKISEEASKSVIGACGQVGQKCYDPSATSNTLLVDCCGYQCDSVSGTCIDTDVGLGESCNGLNQLCNERQSLVCIQETCQYVPKYCAECIYEGGACSINDDKCCSNSGLMCVSGECRQPTKKTDRYFTTEAVYNYNWETDAESVSCSDPSLTLINPETTQIVDDEFQDNYDVNDFYAVLISNKVVLYQFKFNFPIFEYFDVEDNTETLGFPCYEGVGNVQIVISRGTDVFYTRGIDMVSVCQLQSPAKSAEAGEEDQGGGIISNIVTFFQNLFGLNG